VCSRKITKGKGHERLMTALATGYFERLFCSKLAQEDFFKNIKEDGIKKTFPKLWKSQKDWDWTEDVEDPIYEEKEIKRYKSKLAKCLVKALLDPDVISKTLIGKKSTFINDQWKSITKLLQSSMVIYEEDEDEEDKEGQKFPQPKSLLKEPLALLFTKSCVKILYTVDEVLALSSSTFQK